MRRKFVGIELLRFICAFSIIIIHNRNFIAESIYVADAVSKTIDFPFHQFLYRYMRQSVQLFWTISGFVLFMTYSDAFYEKRVSFKEFVVIRLSRLYPLHLLTLFLVVALQLVYHQIHDLYFFYTLNFDLYHFFLHLFLVSHWGFERGYSFNQAIWSVSVEDIACLIFFLTAFKIRLKLVRTLVIVVALSIVVYQELLISNISNCILLFFCGGLMYQLYCELDSLTEKIKKIIGWLAFSVALALMVANQTELGSYFHLSENHFKFLFLKSLVLVPSVILFFILVINPAATGFTSKFIQWLGKSAYATYLIHFPMQILFVLISDKLNIPRESYNAGPIFFIYLFCVYGISYLLHFKFEMPAMRYIRSKFLGKKKGALQK